MLLGWALEREIVEWTGNEVRKVGSVGSVECTVWSVDIVQSGSIKYG